MYEGPAQCSSTASSTEGPHGLVEAPKALPQALLPPEHGRPGAHPHLTPDSQNSSCHLKPKSDPGIPGGPRAPRAAGERPASGEEPARSSYCARAGPCAPAVQASSPPWLAPALSSSLPCPVSSRRLSRPARLRSRLGGSSRGTGECHPQPRSKALCDPEGAGLSLER